jgi:hypothetical protein
MRWNSRALLAVRNKFTAKPFLASSVWRMEPYAREEVLEKCFADLLKGLVFDDQVMD